MLRLDLDSSSDHGLVFTVFGARVPVEDIAAFVAAECIEVDSEHDAEEAAHDITHAIMEILGRRVMMARESKDRAGWVSRNPPNHAGFYYCHLCGMWVHIDQADLDEVEPKSYRTGQDPLRDDNRRMSHAWPIVDASGKQLCPGNRGKGSRQLPSATMEIAPPDGEI